MKKSRPLLLLFAVVIITSQGCLKDEIFNNEAFKGKEISSIIEQVNQFKPEPDKVSELYNSFLLRIKFIKENNQAYFKDDPNMENSPIDMGAWLIETVINNEYGLKNDSIVYEMDTVQYYTLDIIDYDPNDIPIVRGEDLDAIYMSIGEKIIEGNSNDRNFWMCEILLDTITANTLTISVLPFTGQIYHCYSVLPPGVDPDPFPSGTNLRSCNYYNGIAPLWKEIEWSIRGGTWVLPAPGYIFVSYGAFTKSWYNLYYYDNRFWSGTSANEILNTEQCNYYLFAQKEVVDENNPHSTNPNLIIGTFLMSYVYSENPVAGKTYWHFSVFYIFETVYVGFPD